MDHWDLVNKDQRCEEGLKGYTVFSALGEIFVWKCLSSAQRGSEDDGIDYFESTE